MGTRKHRMILPMPCQEKTSSPPDYLQQHTLPEATANPQLHSGCVDVNSMMYSQYLYYRESVSSNLREYPKATTFPASDLDSLMAQASDLNLHFPLSPPDSSSPTFEGQQGDTSSMATNASQVEAWPDADYGRYADMESVCWDVNSDHFLQTRGYSEPAVGSEQIIDDCLHPHSWHGSMAMGAAVYGAYVNQSPAGPIRILSDCTELVQEPENITQGKYECGYCHQVLTSQNLLRHQKFHCPNRSGDTGKAELKCSRCGKLFSRPDSRKMHEKKKNCKPTI